MSNLFTEVEDHILAMGEDPDSAKYIAVGIAIAIRHSEWAMAFLKAARENGASSALVTVPDVIVELHPAEAAS